jgi:D-glycero-alpha-D-manno-heptose 1-phosphate guanylyltransferase
MQAILLAGGLGTRLRSVVSDRPKPMALIEDKPFMEYVVHELSRHGITDIIFAVGYKGSMVEEYFGDGSHFTAPDGTSISVKYAYEEELLGTAGAIKNAGKHVTEDRFYVLNADTFYQIDYSRLTQLQEKNDLAMTLVLREVPDVSRYGQAVLDADGFLTGFNEKTTEAKPGTINGGVYLMTRELLADIPDGKVSLENEMIPKWLGEGRRLGGFVNDGYFIDIGIPEAYYQFMDDVKNKIVKW